MPRSPERARVGAHAVERLDHGWEAARAPSGPWLPARVPGTAAGVLQDAGHWRPGAAHDFDAEDWWFRLRFPAAPAAPGEEVVLRFDGLATACDVTLNGAGVLATESMFARHAIDVGALLDGDNELVVHCHALAPLLAVRRRPRARWRTRLADGNLRWYRTALLGRAPGFAPGPAPVGPWRPVLLERRRALAVDALELRPRVDGDDGVLAVRVSCRSLGATALQDVAVELDGPSGRHRLALRGGAGELRVPGAARWWPHTHGHPALHAVRLEVQTGDGPVAVDAGRTGFRTLDGGPDPAEEGLGLRVNGVPLFARGAVWTPAEPVGLAPAEATLRAQLEHVRAAGMNLVRVPGIGVYESARFHDLCDELGLLVWQDFMFANFDYPIADPGFGALVADELADVLDGLAGRPSLAVTCGNSEVEQQAAMLGLDPAQGRGELFGRVVPAAVAAAGADAVHLPSTPCGGTLPFRPDRGVAHYYGVGAYRRPLEDARRTAVRFASECLAFANVPDPPRAVAPAPRDVGADWDFADVRDHYLRLLYEVDPDELRAADPERYLGLSRSVSGEVMAEVLGEWRRAGSPCAGAVLLWLRDVAPGAGWGLLDDAGAPKVAYHHVRRALAPAAVWITDEGLSGMLVHVANDRAESLHGQVDVALWRGEHMTAEARAVVDLPPHGDRVLDVEALLGRFADVAWAYRFGPPEADTVVATLRDAGGDLLSQAVRWPAGRPAAPEPAASLGLRAGLAARDGRLELTLAAARPVLGVRVDVPGYVPGDDAFVLAPGAERRVGLAPAGPGARFAGGALSAVNLSGSLSLSIAEAAA